VACEKRNGDLAAVRVPRQDQIGSVANGVEHGRIVGEKHRGRGGSVLVERAHDVGSSRPAVVDARDVELCGAAPNGDAGVAEDHEAMRREPSRKLVRAAEMVVVAERHDDAVARLEFLEHAGHRLLERRSVRHEIARDGDQIGSEPVGLLDPSCSPRRRRQPPDVQIAHLYDPVAVELAAKALDRNLDASHDHPAPADVDAPHAQGEERRVRSEREVVGRLRCTPVDSRDDRRARTVERDRRCRAEHRRPMDEMRQQDQVELRSRSRAIGEQVDRTPDERYEKESGYDDAPRTCMREARAPSRTRRGDRERHVAGRREVENDL
jgi:hypothetical protein